jgi:hypothetical protein
MEAKCNPIRSVPAVKCKRSIGLGVARLIIPTYRTRDGTTTSRSRQAQAAQSISATEEGIAEKRPTRAFKTESKKAVGSWAGIGIIFELPPAGAVRRLIKCRGTNGF